MMGFVIQVCTNSVGPPEQNHILIAYLAQDMANGGFGLVAHASVYFLLNLKAF